MNFPYGKRNYNTAIKIARMNEVATYDEGVDIYDIEDWDGKIQSVGDEDPLDINSVVWLGHYLYGFPIPDALMESIYRMSLREDIHIKGD